MGGAKTQFRRFLVFENQLKIPAQPLYGATVDGRATALYLNAKFESMNVDLENRPDHAG